LKQPRVAGLAKPGPHFRRQEETLPGLKIQIPQTWEAIAFSAKV
jgi:hypothetical protein